MQNHPIAISNTRKGTKWSHRIAPHIYREREWIETDLLFAGTAKSYVLIDSPHILRKRQCKWREILTDGQRSIVELGTSKPNILNTATPILQSRE